MSIIVFGETPPAPKSCPTCKRPRWHWNGEKWQCLACSIENPCITQYGPDSQRRICKNCAHLIREHYHNKTYLKCEMREHTRGAGSDHKASWPACARFEQRGSEEEE